LPGSNDGNFLKQTHYLPTKSYCIETLETSGLKYGVLLNYFSHRRRFIEKLIFIGNKSAY